MQAPTGSLVVRGPSGLDQRYLPADAHRYGLIHDFRGSRADFGGSVHSPSTIDDIEPPAGHQARRSMPRVTIGGAVTRGPWIRLAMLRGPALPRHGPTRGASPGPEVHPAAPESNRRPGIENARRNRSPSRSLPPGASTWRSVVHASIDLTVLVRCLSGQDVMYPAPAWSRYPLIHDLRRLEAQFRGLVHSLSTMPLAPSPTLHAAVA